MNHCFSITNANKTFWACACKLIVRIIKIEHVRRRIYRAKSSIYFQCWNFAFNLKSAAWNCLNDISVKNVFFEGFNFFCVFKTALFLICDYCCFVICFWLSKIRKVQIRKALFDFFNGSLKINLVFLIVLCADVDFFAEMVKYNKSVAYNKCAFWNSKLVFLFCKVNCITAGTEFVA